MHATNGTKAVSQRFDQGEARIFGLSTMFADGYGTGDSSNWKPVQQMRLAGEKLRSMFGVRLEPRRVARSKHC